MLRCAHGLAAKSVISVFGSPDPVTDGTLQSLIIAKGIPQLAAQLQAVGRLPAAFEAQALSPFADSSSKTADKPGRKSVTQAGPVLSPQDSSEMLQQQLVQPQSSLSHQAVIQMLYTASSPGQQPQAYLPALCNRCALLQPCLTQT